MRRFGLLGRLATVAVVLVVGAVGIWFLTRATAPSSSVDAADIPALQVAAAKVKPGSAVPVDLVADDPGTPPQAAQTGATGASGGSATTGSGAGTSLTAWATKVAAATGIPEPAVWAYGNAEVTTRATDPSCQLSWATLAGIGRVESDHGQYGGAHLLADGEESKPIIGVPLDGNGGVADIPDTDHGALDGDPVYDHAVGPMQFLPQTWYEYGVSAGNGPADPENIDDAALTAARYLCSGGRNMDSPSGWWAGVMSYNNSVEYGQKVFGQADNYAQAAMRALTG